MKNAVIISNPMDSIIDYEYPYCQAVHSLEADVGIISCECGEQISCDVFDCLASGDISDEVLA